MRTHKPAWAVKRDEPAIGLRATPSVLFVYFTYTKQTLKVVEAMAEVLRGRGCDVQLAAMVSTGEPR